MTLLQDQTEVVSKPENGTGTYTGPTTEQIANKLLEIRFPEVVRHFSSQSNGPFEQQIQELQNQLQNDSLPEVAKQHLKAAVEVVMDERSKANQPMLDNIAIAILTVIAEYRIPLQFKNHKASDTLARGAGKRGGVRNRAARLDHVLQVSKQAGADGFSTGQVMDKLNISRALAVKLCKILSDKGDLQHNGQRGFRSRFYAVGQVAK